jgi:hypothetical protein
VILRLDHGVTPAVGTTRPISRHPFVGWHHFANVPAAPGTARYRMVVSRAGDWTSAFVEQPPPHVWVRGIPTMGVANVRKLFAKVVLVATGSGIGPMLGHLLDTSVVWVTKNRYIGSWLLLASAGVTVARPGGRFRGEMG